MKQKKKILLGVTGSIAAYKAADIIRRLLERDFEVNVVMTNEAEEFITPLTLATLSGRKVHRHLFEGDSTDWSVNHISLAKEAAAILIAPVTANMIGKMAAGIADDLLSCLVLATEAPILLAPAMNDVMFNNKIVQENCRKLKEIGVHFVEPMKGKLACGTVGVGHLADVEDIIKKVEKILK